MLKGSHFVGLEVESIDSLKDGCTVAALRWKGSAFVAFG